jgi:hypothetical protein
MWGVLGRDGRYDHVTDRHDPFPGHVVIYVAIKLSRHEWDDRTLPTYWKKYSILVS